MNKWFFILGLLVIFSCSRDNDLGDSTEISQENFVDLSMAKEIGAEISFKSNDSNPQTGKNTSFGTVKKKIKTVDEVKNDNGNTVFYVINYLKGGYIILSADDRAQPIIGFSDGGTFVVDKDKETSYPLGLESWMGNAKKQITNIQKSKNKRTEKEKIVWSKVHDMLVSQNLFGKAPVDKCYDRITIYTKGPFVKSFWDQGNGYNGAMPYITCNGDAKRALAGCVPIAMGQVMRYYEYPTNYDWSFIPINFATEGTANFMLDVHNAIRNVYPMEPSYSCGATGVSKDCDMGKVLKAKFGYSSADRGNYDEKVIKSNLEEGRPVILSGFSSAGGHMWVCDGYKTIKFEFSNCTGQDNLYFNMNWGWGGKSNGFFAYNDFSLSDTFGGDVSNAGFNKDVKMIYNIKP